MPRALLLAVLLLAVFVPAAKALPDGFTESTVWSELGNPTVVRFAPDGRAFVATKAGLVYTFDSVDDPTPTLFADLRAEVQDFWDRGLLGLALAPNGQDVYVLYSVDTGWGDTCPDGGTAPPGCRISGRLSRLDAVGRETVLLEDFCQQFPSHSVGTLAFGPDGMLYLSAGDGAHFNYVDFGQIGNECHDPPAEFIGPPDTQGGAFRAQSFRRPPGQPVSLDGAILRVDPATGLAAPGNPASGDRARIVAYGFPQPVPLHVPAGDGRDLVRRRRLDHVGGDQPYPGHLRSPQLRLAVLRGRRSPARLRRARRDHVRGPLRR